MDVFQVFKIIFGLIVSFFVLYFIISYMSDYGSVEEGKLKIDILKNFEETVKNVQYSGNPVGFEDFSKSDVRLTLDPDSGNIRSDFGPMRIETPLFFSLGDEVFIDRGSVDLGWWKFYFAEAMPETRIVFNPVGATQESWEASKSIIRAITQNLPNSFGQEPKVTFVFCNGNAVDDTDTCGPGNDEVCEEENFLDKIDSLTPTSFLNCNANLQRTDKPVKISGDCSANRFVCIERPGIDGIGKVFLESDGSYFYHKDDVSGIVAMIIGGGEQNLYGIAGENLFKYKSEVFAERVGLASKIMAQRARLLAGRSELSQDCRTEYGNFASTLDSAASKLSNQNYYKNSNDLKQLWNDLNEAKTQYGELVGLGCEYEME